MCLKSAGKKLACNVASILLLPTTSPFVLVWRAGSAASLSFFVLPLFRQAACAMAVSVSLKKPIHVVTRRMLKRAWLVIYGRLEEC